MFDAFDFTSQNDGADEATVQIVRGGDSMDVIRGGDGVDTGLLTPLDALPVINELARPTYDTALHPDDDHSDAAKGFAPLSDADAKVDDGEPLLLVIANQDFYFE